MTRKTILAFFLTIVGLHLAATSETHAQCCNQFLGWNSIRSGNNIIMSPPPYFALYPPVYYDRIVPRAYGISPYAVPPGVMPVENSVAPAAKTISNPFFKPEQSARGKKQQQQRTKTANNKRSLTPAKVVVNPFYRPRVAKQ